MFYELDTESEALLKKIIDVKKELNNDVKFNSEFTNNWGKYCNDIEVYKQLKNHNLIEFRFIAIMGTRDSIIFKGLTQNGKTYFERKEKYEKDRTNMNNITNNNNGNNIIIGNNNTITQTNQSKELSEKDIKMFLDNLENDIQQYKDIEQDSRNEILEEIKFLKNSDIKSKFFTKKLKNMLVMFAERLPNDSFIANEINKFIENIG
ncbi:MAG: hypothetical protein R3Y29_04295 [bacterium]